MDQKAVEIAQWLKLTLGVDNEQRKKAEEQLGIRRINTLEYFNVLMQIIMNNSGEADSQIRYSAALELKRAVKSACESEVYSEIRLTFATNIFSALVSNGLDSKIRSALGFSLIPVFTEQGDLIYCFLPTLIASLSLETYSLLGALKAIKSIYCGFTHNPMLLMVLQKLMPGLIDVCSRTVSSFICASANNNESLADELSEVIEEWATTLEATLESLTLLEVTPTPYELQFSDIFIPELSLAFKEVIGIVLPTNQLSLVNTHNSQIVIHINKAKTKIFQCFNTIFKHLLIEKQKSYNKQVTKAIAEIDRDLPDSPFVNTIHDLLPLILASLQSLSQATEQILTLPHIADLYIELLSLTTSICADNRFSTFFMENFKQIVVNVCFPLIKCTVIDMETFEESPEEFVATSNEICEVNECNTIKNAAASLLRAVCVAVNGCLKFSVILAIEAIDCTIRQRPVGQYALLAEFSGCDIIKTSEELRLESMCLVLCVLSRLVSQRTDLLKIIEKLLENDLQLIYTSGTAIIRSRLCLLIQNYSEFVFPEQPSAFNTIIQTVLACCNPQLNPASSLSVQSSETLSFLLQDETVLPKISIFIPELLTSLISLIDLQTNKSFFEALQEIITSNISIVLPHLSSLIPNIVAKIIKETNSRSSESRKSSIINIKCWNVARALIECKALSVEQVLELEIQFSPLLEFIKTPNDIEYDDDIILFEVTVMKRCKVVTNIGWTMFESLSLVQEKYENTFAQVFQALNCYLLYGRQVLERNNQLLARISDMCGKCLFAVFREKVNEAANAEAALIFQQMLLSYRGQLSEALPGILAFTILKLSRPIRNDFFKARVLGIIITAFSYDIQQTLQVLKTSISSSNQSYFDHIISEIQKNLHVFKHPYDKKIAIKGLFTFFTRPELSDSFNFVFQACIEILSNRWKEILPLQAELKLESESEIESMKETIKDFNSEEMEANLAVNTFLNPLGDFDEVEAFKSFVKGLPQNDLAVLVRNLTQAQVNKLTEILQSKRVSIAGNPLLTDVRRIVRPINKTLSK